MRELFMIVKALGLGAGLMYLLDPESGPQRRSKLRRQALEAAAVVGDETDKLISTAGHKLAEQGCQICDQIKHAVTGNGHHHSKPATAVPESVAAVEVAEEPKAEAACPFAESRLLTGISGSVLLAYGLRSRSPFALLATAIGVGLLTKAILHETQELAPDETRRDEPDPTVPSDPTTESRWHVARP